MKRCGCCSSTARSSMAAALMHSCKAYKHWRLSLTGQPARSHAIHFPALLKRANAAAAARHACPPATAAGASRTALQTLLLMVKMAPKAQERAHIDVCTSAPPYLRTSCCCRRPLLSFPPLIPARTSRQQPSLQRPSATQQVRLHTHPPPISLSCFTPTLPPPPLSPFPIKSFCSRARPHDSPRCAQGAAQPIGGSSSSSSARAACSGSSCKRYSKVSSCARPSICNSLNPTPPPTPPLDTPSKQLPAPAVIPSPCARRCPSAACIMLLQSTQQCPRPPRPCCPSLKQDFTSPQPMTPLSLHPSQPHHHRTRRPASARTKCEGTRVTTATLLRWQGCTAARLSP